MEDVDVQSLKEKLNRERFMKSLLQRKSLVSLGITATSLPLLHLPDLPLLTHASLIVVGYEVKTIVECYQRQKSIDKEKIEEVLRSTTTYQECIEAYNKYIEEIATLVKKLNLESSKEVIIYLQNFIRNGEVSKNMSLRNRKKKYESDYLSELTGAKVTTGEATSLHTSAIIRDVLRHLGYETSTIQATRPCIDPVSKVKSYGYTLCEHIIAVKDNEEYYLYDQSKGTFLTTPRRSVAKHKESKIIREVVGSRKPSYIIINPTPVGLNLNDEASIITRVPQQTITESEYLELKRRVEDKAQAHFFETNRFYITHEKQRALIEENYNSLCPSSNEPIKKWLVR